jgi:hypothetical protein
MGPSLYSFSPFLFGSDDLSLQQYIDYIDRNTQPVVEKRLHKLLLEFQQGGREGSIASLKTDDSLSKEERIAWRSVRKALEDVGITPSAFESNKEFIIVFLRNAIGEGLLLENKSGVIATTVREQNHIQNQEEEANVDGYRTIHSSNSKLGSTVATHRVSVENLQGWMILGGKAICLQVGFAVSRDN